MPEVIATNLIKSSRLVNLMGTSALDAGQNHSLRSDGFDEIGIFPWVLRLLQVFGRDPIVDDGQHRLHSGLKVDFFIEPAPPEPDFLALFGRKNFPDVL